MPSPCSVPFPDIRLADIGGSITAWRESRGVWHVSVSGRLGWGLTFIKAITDAMRL